MIFKAEIEMLGDCIALQYSSEEDGPTFFNGFVLNSKEFRMSFTHMNDKFWEDVPVEQLKHYYSSNVPKVRQNWGEFVKDLLQSINPKESELIQYWTEQAVEANSNFIYNIV